MKMICSLSNIIHKDLWESRVYIWAIFHVNHLTYFHYITAIGLQPVAQDMGVNMILNDGQVKMKLFPWVTEYLV